MRIACWIPKATNTHSEYVTLVALPLNHGWTDAPQCYEIVHWLPCFIISSLYWVPEPWHNRGALVGIVSRLPGGFRSLTMARESLFSETTRPAMGPTQPHIPRAPGVNRPGPEADSLPPLVPRLRISGAVTTFPLCAFISGTGMADLLPYFTRATVYRLLLVPGYPERWSVFTHPDHCVNQLIFWSRNFTFKF